METIHYKADGSAIREIRSKHPVDWENNDSESATSVLWQKSTACRVEADSVASIAKGEEYDSSDDNYLDWGVVRNLSKRTEISLHTKFYEYIDSIKERVSETNNRLDKAKEYLQSNNCNYIVGFPGDGAGDLECDSNLSPEETRKMGNKVQSLNNKFRVQFDESETQVKRAFSIIEELKRRKLSITDYERDLDRQMDRLADIDLKSIREVFKVERSR